MAWHLAGQPVLQGQGRLPPEVTPEGARLGRERAARLRERFAIREIDAAGLAAWRSEVDRRTLYVFDVRTPEEYARGHLPGTISAPGGQLVQETDNFAATLGARIVLVDEGSGVRAASTASWLIQIGYWEVAVLAGGLGALREAALETGERPGTVFGWQSLDLSSVDFVPAEDVTRRLSQGDMLLLDVSLSRTHRRAHIPGARFAGRARLAQTLGTMPLPETVIVLSETGALAAFAASELAALRGRRVAVLEGGMAAWRAFGLPTVAGIADPLDEPDDVWYPPRERQGDREAAMRAYLEWEVDLVNAVANDPDCRFRTGGSAAHG
ncbi:MAG TPA: rhodanese-like domain-containing protein [Stellaceae bacterium]|nr:rhodanese-like domain-containing protein [Stellaceae bacterium]